MSSRPITKAEPSTSAQQPTETEKPIQYICANCAATTVNKPAVCISRLYIYTMLLGWSPMYTMWSQNHVQDAAEKAHDI